MREVIIAGTVCWDRLFRLPDFPRQGAYIEAVGYEEAVGGEAVNTCLALRQWGAPNILYGNPIGSGPSADRLRNSLDQLGLRRAVLPGGRNLTPVCDILVTPDGSRTIIGAGFADLPELTAQVHITAIRSSWFSCDLNWGATASQLYHRAAEQGMHIYAMDHLNASELPTGSVWQSSTDWLGKPDDRQQNLAAVQNIAQSIQGVAILTDGPRGTYVAAEGVTVILPTFTPPQVVDTTGAGDIFRAGMLFGLTLGWKLGACCSFASSAAALNCRSLGATKNIPTRAEIETFAADQKATHERILDLLPI